MYPYEESIAEKGLAVERNSSIINRMITLDTFESIVAFAGMGAQLASLALFILILLRKKIFSERVLLILLGVTMILAIGGSFLYSDVYGVEPCKLCWLQRVFLFPQILLVLIALVKRKRGHLYEEIIIFSTFGFLIAVYQSIEQFRAALNPGIGTVCSLEPNSSCSTIHMLKFGYLTFPVVSASVFLLLTLLAWYGKKVLSKR